MKKEERWTMKRTSPAAKEVAELFGLEEVTAGILLNRGLKTRREIRNFLYGGKECLHDPMLLRDMDRACGIIREKMQEGKKICIVGDYDIDGIMATYILKRGLQELGVRADAMIPDRVRDGYGINPDIVRKAHDLGADTIITCDNGISAHEAAACAKEYGMTLVVTDHHEVARMPDAAAVVNPRRSDDEYPNKNLCGAAVAWKLVLALGADRDGRLLQFAGFATVGDVMDLTGENRILVREALRQLQTTDNPGMRALAEVCGVSLADLAAWHIGFVLGPCFNASGRLDTALLGLELLECGNGSAAKRMAEELYNLNESRKAMTARAVEEGEELIRKESWKDDPVYVVYMPDVHESIAGIVAGRLRESSGHPVFVLTKSGENVKGSGRSIDAYDMAAELDKVSGCLLKYGGHPMAAGLSLETGKVEEFRKAVNANCTLLEKDLLPRVSLDALLDVSEAGWKLVDELSLLEPFGKGNPKPLFGQKRVFCEHPRLLGVRSGFLKMRVRSIRDEAADPADGRMICSVPETKGSEIDAVCFHDAEELFRRIRENPVISIAYELGVNTWMGERRLQIVIRNFR